MEWISVTDSLPEVLPKEYCGSYLVCVKRENRQIIRIAQWVKKRHREVGYKESRMQVLKESPLAKWVVCNCKGKDVTHWMPLPNLPPAKGKLEDKNVSNYNFVTM